MQEAGGSVLTLLMFWSAVWLRLSSAAGRVDLTLRSDAMGADVVRAVGTRMDDINLFDLPTSSMAERQAIELFMRESAYVESGDGGQFPLEVRDGGIWRISRDLFDRTRNYSYPELFDEICRVFCINWMSARYSDLRMPLYSGLAARIHLFHLYNTNQGLPMAATDTNRAIFWANAFGGNRLVSRWLSRVEQLRGVEVCQVDTDVMFVLDSSGSIGPANYQTVRNYAYNYTEGLLSGNTNSRVGVILYSDSAHVEFPLDHVTTHGAAGILQQISNLRYIRRFTNTPEGLCLLKYMPWRRSVSVLKLAIVLTDGRSNLRSANCSRADGRPGDVNSTAREVHNLDPPVTVIAIGVANYVREELIAIATSPDLVDELQSFDYRLLLDNQRSRTYFICFQETQEVSMMREQQSGEVGVGSTSRLRISGPGSEGVSTRICIDRGRVVVYGSYTSPNPNLALHDFSQELTADATGGGVTPARCLTSYTTLDDVNARSEDRDVCSVCTESLPVRKRRQANDEEREVVVYITIEGVGDTVSQFSISTQNGSAFECSDSFCGENAVLIRRDAICSCECAQGYEGDGQECNNIDECALPTGNLCGENEECIDTVGNYTCTCSDGYERDAQICTRIIEDTEERDFFQANVYVIVVGVSCGVAFAAIVTAAVISMLVLKARQK